MGSLAVSYIFQIFFQKKNLGLKKYNPKKYFSHLRNFVNQELQRLLVKYPQVMAEVKVMTNELHPDAQKHSQV